MSSDHFFIIIPVKNLDNAKSRLTPFLNDDERRRLCLKMLEDVLKAIMATNHFHKTVIVSNDPRVMKMAKLYSSEYLKERKTELNEILLDAINLCIEQGAKFILIVPADIPLVMPIDLNEIFSLRKKASVVISPSLDGGGTNALLLTPPNLIPTCYGSNSFHRHIEEATRLKISNVRYLSPRIALDLDTIGDIEYFFSVKAKETSTYKILEQIFRNRE